MQLARELHRTSRFLQCKHHGLGKDFIVIFYRLTHPQLIFCEDIRGRGLHPINLLRLALSKSYVKLDNCCHRSRLKVKKLYTAAVGPSSVLLTIQFPSLIQIGTGLREWSVRYTHETPKSLGRNSLGCPQPCSTQTFTTSNNSERFRDFPTGKMAITGL